MSPVITAASSSTAAKSVNLSIIPSAAMNSTGHATSRRPLRVSDSGVPPRDATKSHPITAALAAAATIAIIASRARLAASHSSLRYLLSTCRMARKASCGTSTEPICFMRFLPAFCFSSSFFLRVMSPP